MVAELGAQIIKVPQPAGLVQTSTDDEIARRVPVGTHDLVAVAREDDHVPSCLPVHDAHTVVVTCREDPRQLRVERDGTDVVGVQRHFEQHFA